VDTSYHKSLKLTPVQIRYSIPIKVDGTEVIAFHKLKRETVEVLTRYIIVVLRTYNLLAKDIALFGGQI
jgi:hypothetical protein